MSTSQLHGLRRIKQEIRKYALTRRQLFGQAAAGATLLAIGAGERATAAPSGRLGNAPARSQDAGVFNIFHANFADLDPQVITDGMWFVGTSLLEGLVLADEKGSGAIPGQAESWEVSDDGTTYTFTIRERARWSNGDPVTAHDFEWTYRRLLTPGAATGNTAGAKSYQQILGIVGAREFLAGEISDWDEVGITALDERTLQIRLTNPNAEFLVLMTHPSMLGMWPGIEEIGADWSRPEHFVGNGPFVPTEWVTNASLTLAPNEHYWDRANVFLPGVNVQLTTGADTAVSAAYEAGEVDALALGGADLVRYQADPELSQQLQAIGGGSVAYMALLRSQNTTLEDVRVREAIALAIDRETLAQTNPALRPGPQLVPDSVPGWDESLNVPYDPDRARQLLAEAGFPDGEGFPTLTFLRGGTSSVTDEALIDLISQTLNIECRLDVVEAGTYTEQRWRVQEEDYIGFYLGSFGSQPTWSSWAANLWGPQFTEEFSLPSSVYAEYYAIQNDPDLDPVEKTKQLAAIRAEHASEAAKAYSAKVEEAASTPDPEQQIALFKEASRLRQETYLFIPMWYNDQYWAVKPYIENFHLHPGGRPYYLRGVRKNV